MMQSCFATYLKYSNKTLQSLVDSVSDIQNDLSLQKCRQENQEIMACIMAIAFYDISGADMMLKGKPTQVVVHRIEFQDKERDMLEASLLGARVEGAAKAAVLGVASVGIGLAGYSAYWALKKMYNWGLDAKETIEEVIIPTAKRETVGTVTGDASVIGGITDAGGFGPFGTPLRVIRGFGRLLR